MKEYRSPTSGPLLCGFIFLKAFAFPQAALPYVWLDLCDRLTLPWRCPRRGRCYWVAMLVGNISKVLEIQVCQFHIDCPHTYFFLGFSHC